MRTRITVSASIDKLRRVDLVTADGELVKASADENAELFWGVRGGGGNFGIVTEFEFDLVPVGPEVLAGPYSRRLLVQLKTKLLPDRSTRKFGCVRNAR